MKKFFANIKSNPMTMRTAARMSSLRFPPNTSGTTVRVSAGSSMSTTSARMPDLRRFLFMPCRATEIRMICFRVRN